MLRRYTLNSTINSVTALAIATCIFGAKVTNYYIGESPYGPWTFTSLLRSPGSVVNWASREAESDTIDVQDQFLSSECCCGFAGREKK